MWDNIMGGHFFIKKPRYIWYRYQVPCILDSQMSLSSKYLQRLDSPWILSQNFSVLEHWPTNQIPISISLDQQTSQVLPFSYMTQYR